MAKIASFQGSYASQFDVIARQLVPQMTEYLKEKMVDDLQQIFKDAIDKISANWEGGANHLESLSAKRKVYGAPTYIPKPEDATVVISRISKNGVTASAKIKFAVIDSDGSLHDLFIWLNFGTQSVVWRGFSAPFPYRSPNRTIPRSYAVRSGASYAPFMPGRKSNSASPTIVYKGSTGEGRTILAPGSLRQGIEAREWTVLIENDIRQKIASDYPSFTVSSLPTGFEQ